MVGYDGKLIKEVKELSKPVEETFFFFEDNEATALMLLNGIEIKEFNTCSSIEYAIQEAKEMMERYNVGEDSVVTLKVVNRVYETKRRMVEPFIDGSPRYEDVGGSKTLSETIVWDSIQGYVNEEVD